MLKIKPSNAEIIKLEEEFKQTAFIDPKFDYNPLYKYKSFYIDNEEGLERCGVIRLSYDEIEKTRYIDKYEKIDFKVYSNNSGFFKLENISFHRGKNFDNVYEPLVYYKNNSDDNYSILEYDYIYMKEEIDDIMVIYSELIKGGNKFNLYNVFVNENGIIKHVIENVISYNYLHKTKEKISYIKMKNTKKEQYLFYIFDYYLGEETFLGEQDNIHMYDEGMRTLEIAKSVKDSKRTIVDKENVYFYFSADSSAGCNVFMEFLKTANGLEKIKNIFSKDVTENYMAWFSIDRTEDIQFACYIFLKFNISGLKIFGYEVKNISKIIDYGSDVYRYYIKNKLKKEYEYMIRIYEILKDTYSNKDKELVEFLTKEFGVFSVDWLATKVDPYRKQAKIKHPLGLEKSILKNYDLGISTLYQEALLNDEDKVRWKSEFSLFRLINEHFSDAIYQYRCLWLGQQSLDIFLPNKNIAIEYQGEQHYKSIEIFGGKEGLKATKDRDKRKRKLCKENKVKLIEWKYDYPINIINLANTLKEYKIDIYFDENNLV